MTKTKTKTRTKATTKAKNKPATPKPRTAEAALPAKPLKKKRGAAGPAAESAPVEAIDCEAQLPPAPTALEAAPASPLASGTVAGSSPEAADGSRSEPLLPPVGTVLRKLDRRGELRCEATITAEGVSYSGKVYRSLSAAAVAAARDLGLSSRSMNGPAWFGLAKPARAGAGRDPLTALQRRFDRYAEHLDVLLEKAKAGEHREPVLTTLQRHARVLQNLHDEVA